jgi:positive regulator of sigma E activity
MAVWANVHGGFALGQATIIVYLVAEGTKFAHGSLRPIKREAYRALLVAGGAGLAASLLNPNTYHAVWIAVATGTAPGSHGFLKIQEYLSITESLMIYHDYIRVVDLALMAVVAIAIVSRPRNLDITAALLAAGTGYLAFKHARFMPVFMIVALPLAGHFLSRGAWVRHARVLASACAFALVFIYSRDEHLGLARLRTGDWVNPVEFPVLAADYVLARNLRGNMYNYYTWGGYLIWRLAPERRVFLDGRNINPDIFWESAMIDEGVEIAGKPQWKLLFEKYDIRYAIFPLKKRGKPVPLVKSLSRDPEWVAVFINNNSVIFTRKTPGPR